MGIPVLQASHVRERVNAATLITEPGPHMVVTDLLPPDLYALLMETMPPPDRFDIADEVKANFDPESTTIAPERSRQTWKWFQQDLIGEVLTPVLLERFHPSLTAAYRALFGPGLAEEALRLRQHTFRGRLMLRRPGYRLKPHRDSKIVAMTGLIYFARAGDSAEYGTDLYRVQNDQQAASMKTFYPESHGARVDLARSIPFMGNTALVFLNVPGMAHGAAFPRDATQTERYAYQFYIGPPEPDLARLVLQMPIAERAAWAGVNLPADAAY